eukprot:ANDGO_02626.mRNA.1 hypothetical protein NAEGRDRAFT_50227
MEIDSDWLSLSVDSAEEFKKIAKSSKSADEIARYEIDPMLNDTERIKLLLSKKDSVQINAALQYFTRCMYRTQSSSSVQSNLFAAIHNIVVSSLAGRDTDFQREAARCYRGLIQCFPALCISGPFVSFLLSMMSSKSHEVAKEWTLCMHACLAHECGVMTATLITEVVIPFGISKSNVSETTWSRVLAASVLCLSCSRVDTAIARSQILDRALALCQDTDADVRLCMAHGMRHLGSCFVPLSTSKPSGVPSSPVQNGTASRIARELDELLVDEEQDVRSAALSSYSMLYPLFGDLKKSVRARIISRLTTSNVVPFMTHNASRGPLFCGCCAPVSCPLMSSRTCPCVCSSTLTECSFHDFCRFVGPECQDEAEIRALLEFYQSSSAMDVLPVRMGCAVSFSKLLRVVGSRKFALHLHSVLVTLCGDPREEIRAIVASSLADIAATLGCERSAQYLKDIVCSLITDSCPVGVTMSLFPKLQSIFSSTLVSSEEVRVRILRDFSLALLQAEGNTAVRNNFRFRCALADALCGPLQEADSDVILLKMLPSDIVLEKLLPIVYKNMLTGVRPLRESSCNLFAQIFKHALRDVSKRWEYFERLCGSDFARSRSFSQRLVFFDVLQSFSKVYSSKYVRERFVESVLHLAKDPVYAVRYRFVKMIPFLKTIIRPPAHVDLVAKFNERVSFLTMDKDPEVALLAKSLQNSSSADSSFAKQDAKLEDDEREIYSAELEYDRKRKRLTGRTASAASVATASSGSASDPALTTSRRGSSSASSSRSVNSTPASSMSSHSSFHGKPLLPGARTIPNAAGAVTAPASKTPSAAQAARRSSVVAVPPQTSSSSFSSSEANGRLSRTRH